MRINTTEINMRLINLCNLDLLYIKTEVSRGIQYFFTLCISDANE